MIRAIDHIVIAARDLAAQAELYRRLGFQVGARNRHPWGTENHIVQFDGAFLELIGLGEGFVVPPEQPGVFSFARFIDAYLALREGLAMLVIRSDDAESDRLRFAREGIGVYARFDFARKARRPDGGEVDVAFSLAFAHSAALPGAGFFVCQQRFPENFWRRELQAHPNSATGIAGLVLCAPRPREPAGFLWRFVGGEGARDVDGGVAIDADGSTIEVLTPGAIEARYGANVISGDAPPLAILRIAVADLAVAETVVASAGAPFVRQVDRLLLPASGAFGAALILEPLM
jgi:hypothetical protein